jgi:hypothetical protein
VGVEPTEPRLGSRQIISLLGLPMPNLSDRNTKGAVVAVGVEPTNHPGIESGAGRQTGASSKVVHPIALRLAIRNEA